MRRYEDDDRLEAYQAALLVIAAALLFGAGGYAAGVGLASNFGVAVVGLVSAAFGFAVAALFT